MNKGRKMKQLIAILLIIALSWSNVTVSEYTVSAKTDTSFEEYKELLSKISTDGTDYKDYLTLYNNTKRPDVEYVIEAKDFVRVENMEVEECIDYGTVHRI